MNLQHVKSDLSKRSCFSSVNEFEMFKISILDPINILNVSEFNFHSNWEIFPFSDAEEYLWEQIGLFPYKNILEQIFLL